MYERFFGLVDAPFRLTPDPRYLYLSRKHADALAHLRMGLSESSGFVCVTGDVGTGKTTLLRAFLAELEPTVATAYVFNPSLSALELLQTICAEFGLPAATDSKRDLVDRLNRHLFVQRLAGRRSVVVIDEAQALGVEVLEQLRLLSNLETTTEKLLRVVLVGQPQLQRLLLHPELVQLNQRITLRWHIGPLSRAETAGYVRHRLAVASRDRVGDVFRPGALRLIHRLSGGVPRLVNMIAHRALLAAFAIEARQVGAGHVWQSYRELSAVPLPSPSPTRRPVWALAGAVLSLGAIALGASLLALQPSWTRGPEAPAPVASREAPPTLAEAAAPPAPPAAVAAVYAGPDASPPSDVVDTASLMTKLGVLDRGPALAAALDAVLATWQVDPLAHDEVERQSDVRNAVLRRGLEWVAVEGSIDMLRLIDVPALLELWVADGVRHAAVVELDGSRIVLQVGDERVPIDEPTLLRTWTGMAQVVWRDFERLGPTSLSERSRGGRVARLQALLRQAGVYAGEETGVFDPATAAAVLEFQRTRRLEPDAEVGRLTRLVLYGAVGGYTRPSLTAAAPATKGTS